MTTVRNPGGVEVQTMALKESRDDISITPRHNCKVRGTHYCDTLHLTHTSLHQGIAFFFVFVEKCFRLSYLLMSSLVCVP